MATRDGERYLAPAIDSVLAQTHGDLELLIVDDGSTDGTVAIAAEYANRDPARVRRVASPGGEGPCRARNRALADARGPLVCWLDQDDLWLPAKLERQVALMAARPELGLVYTHVEHFDSRTGDAIEAIDSRRDIEGDVLRELFTIGCFIGSLTAMFRREALDRRGGRLRDRDFSLGDDYYLWLTLALDWQVAVIPEVLARYRRHDGNESSRMAAALNVAAWRVGLLREFIAEFPQSRDRLGDARRAGLAWHSLLAFRTARDAGRRAEAARWALRALAYSPATVARTRLGSQPGAFA